MPESSYAAALAELFALDPAAVEAVSRKPDEAFMITLRLGTRGSRLARAQAGEVARRVEEGLGVTVELVPVPTAGDRSGSALTEIGGQGVFVGAVRQALVEGRIDLGRALAERPADDNGRQDHVGRRAGPAGRA